MVTQRPAVTKKTLPAQELSAFCLQMALLLRSGIPAGEGASILCEDAAESEREWLSPLAERLDLGEPFFSSLEQAGRFPQYLVDMCRIGETTGRLDDVLFELSRYYTKEEDLKKTIKSTVAYPAVMLVMMAAVVFLLLTKVLPIFQQVFQQLGAVMSPVAQGLLSAGSWLGRFSAAGVGILAAALLGVWLYSRTQAGRAAFARWSAASFGWKKFATLSAMRRFSSAMTMTLKSGLDLDESMEMTARLVDYPPMRQKVEECRRWMDEGQAFEESIAKAGILPAMYSRMLGVGVRTGQLDTVMEEISRRCDEQLDDLLSRAIGVVEPAMVAVLSIVIGLILMTVMLPLMGVMSSII